MLTGPLADAVGSAVGLGSAAVTAWDIAKWPVLLAVVIAMIALLYYASPNAKLGGLKSIVPGAAVAVVVWLIASAGFAFYVANFGPTTRPTARSGRRRDVPRLDLDHQCRRCCSAPS